MPDRPDPAAEPPSPLRPWAALGFGDYRRIFVLSLFATTAQQMRDVQNLYQVYELSGSALQLGLTGLAQAIPVFAFGLFGGILADFIDRRKLLLMTTGGNLLIALALAVLTLGGWIRVWHIQGATALTSTLAMVLNPTRNAMISLLVPRSHVTNAVSLNSSVSQAARFIGPLLAGFFLAAMSAGNAYLMNALFHVPAVLAVVRLHIPPGDGRTRERLSWLSLLGGLRFFLTQPIVFAMVMLDFVTTGLGYFPPLLPIFAKDILHVGPAGFGMLSSAPAVGGMIGTAALLLAGDIRHKGRLALGSFFSYAALLGLFAVSDIFWLSLVLLAGLGLVNAVQTVMRQTTFHLLTPDHVRGRAFSVFSMFSQGANSVGAAEAGFAAALVGAPAALGIGCGVGCVVTLGCWALWPALRRFR